MGVGLAGDGKLFFEQFTGPLTAWWKVLGSPQLTPEVRQKLIDGVHAEVGSRSVDELAAERDEVLLGLLERMTSPRSFSSAAGVFRFVMKPLGALRFDIRREVRNSGEPRVHRTLIRLAPA